MKIGLTTLLFGLVFLSCKERNLEPKSIINDNHLDHLYESYSIGSQKIGSIWIYCEAPDYYLVTDDDEGYTCVDDVARSLVFYAQQYDETPSEKIENKIYELTRFLLSMQAENAYFYNFIFPDKSINKTHINSVAEENWWSWRAFWALSEVAKIKNARFSDLRKEAKSAMEKLLPLILQVCSIRDGFMVKEGVSTPLCASQVGGDQVALMMIGLSNYYELHPSEEVKAKLLDFGDILESLQLGDEDTFPYYASMSWQNIWHAWGNSQAYALLKVGKQLESSKLTKAGKREVDYFIPYFLKENPSFFEIRDSDGEYEVLETSKFPQIAYNLRPMIFATLEAYSLEKEEKYKNQALALARWFFGENQVQRQMYDPSTGRTFDGIISEHEVNPNSGAESTIEALLSLQALSSHIELWKEIENL